MIETLTIGGVGEHDTLPVENPLEAPQKRKRRTKAEMAEARTAAGLAVEEVPVEIKRPTLTDPEKATRGRKKGPDLTVLVETTVVGLFGLVAVATAHEHWLKERADVMAITGPLNAWIDQLPSKTLKKLERNLAPCLFVVGVATVVGPDLVLEMRIRDKQKRARSVLPRPQPGSAFNGPYGHPPTSGPGPTANGVSVPAGPVGGWSDGIPTNGPLDAFGDVG